MPRVSLRRGLFYLAAVTTCSLLLVSVQQPAYPWLPASSPRDAAPSSHQDLAPPQLLQLLENDSPGHGPSASNEEALSAFGAFRGKDGAYKFSDIDPGLQLPFLPNNFSIPPPDKRLWYFRDGKVRPPIPTDPEHYERKQHLWPEEDSGDRITEQLMFRPVLPAEVDPPVGEVEPPPPPYKKIMMYNGMNSWNLKAGRGVFLKLKCPVDTCVLTGSRPEAATADAIMFKDHFSIPPHERPPNQAWIMYMLECPYHTQQFHARNSFNWTATYRHDSDIVTPYERWVYYDNNVRQKVQDINYAANKTKQVAWFVSNCGARNNRLQYARELAKYINVDIYGACGTKRCPRSNSVKCFDMLNKDYKFYLAFENSNCRDYITEKFFVNGLRGLPGQKSHNILPIAMGAHPDDYRRAAPERSFIHVDDFKSAKHLAQYLHLLDQNEHLYNEYFRWKGTGEFINTYFMCRLCALLHDQNHTQHYQDFNKWWRNDGTCTNGSWRKKKEKIRNYPTTNSTTN